MCMRDTKTRTRSLEDQARFFLSYESQQSTADITFVI